MVSALRHVLSILLSSLLSADFSGSTDYRISSLKMERLFVLPQVLPPVSLGLVQGTWQVLCIQECIGGRWDGPNSSRLLVEVDF
jgi:ABC-type molybdate transport system permease subunit